MKTIQEFNVLDLRFSANSSGFHEIFVKEHLVRKYDDKKPAGKTLFVLNVPSYVDEKNLKRIFSSAGKVKYVILQNSVAEKEKYPPCGFKVAYVVFDKREGLLNALKLTTLNPLSSEQDPVPTGITKWIKEYNNSICDHKSLSEEVNIFMSNYDRIEAEKKVKEKEVDDDGWTVVTRKGRNPGIARKESISDKLNRKAQLKSKKKQLKNFYTFQIRESKMKAVAELRKKYENDKNKVETMKKLRKFKPY